MRTFRAILGPVFLATSVATLFVAVAQDDVLPEGKAMETVQHTCTECHGLDKIFTKSASAKTWRTITARMRAAGATMSDAEFESVVEYLVVNFAVDEADETAAKAPVLVNKAGAADLETALGLTAREAAAIVNHRQTNGPFKEWRDVAKVEGVDPAKIEANKDRLVF